MAAPKPVIKKERDGTIRPYCAASPPAGTSSKPEPTQPALSTTEPPQPAPLTAVEPQPASSTTDQSQTPATPHTADAAAGGACGWHYKKKFLPEQLQAEWERLQALPARGSSKNVLKREFKDEAMKLPGLSFESDYFSEFRKIEDQKTEGSDYAWISWHKLKTEEGEDVAL